MRRPFHVMTKPTGAICNLACDYCFFLEKESLYPGSAFRMTPEVQETYIRGVIRAHQGMPTVNIAWQGGEPTMMGLDFYRRAVTLAHKYALPGQQITHTIQTNGTLLTDEWGAFLAEHGFLVGISIDGPATLHDVYRVDKGGKPTHHRVIRGLDVLKRHGVEWNALVTINAANQTHGREVYTYLRDDLGASFMQYIPVVDDTCRSVSPEGYGEFMVQVFDEWAARDVGSVFVQLFDTTLGHWLGLDAGVCTHAETCGTQVALEHNGDLYSCDHYVDPDHLLGNITDTFIGRLVASPQQQAFGLAKRETLPDECRSCEWLFACNGGCPKDRGADDRSYLCSGYRRFFAHVDEPMRRMARFVRAGKSAAEAMS